MKTGGSGFKLKSTKFGLFLSYPSHFPALQLHPLPRIALSSSMLFYVCLRSTNYICSLKDDHLISCFKSQFSQFVCFSFHRSYPGHHTRDFKQRTPCHVRVFYYL